MTTPDDTGRTARALYVVLHAREHTREEWSTAARSCLMGEHGEHAREMVRELARQAGVDIPHGYFE